MKKYISIVLCIAIVLTLVPMELNASTGILEIVYDEQKHQALTYSVRYTPSDAPLQAFAEGWNISIGSIEVLVKVAPSFSGGDRTYVIPLTKGYAKGDATSFLNGSCIEDLVPKSKKEEFYSIISRETGSTITVNAKIQKYKYSNGKYTETGVIADTSTELRNKFSEFSENFLNTTINDYYDLELPITAEPVVTPNTVKAQFKIFYKGNDITDNSNKPAVKDPEKMQLILQDTSTVSDNSNPITEWRWYYWNNGWTSLEGMSGITITDSRVTIDNMDNNLSGSLPLRKGFKLEVTTQSGLQSYATAEGYFKQVNGDITIYYKDVATEEDLYPPTEMKDLSYGTYTVSAKSAPSDYKLITQSPQQVKIDVANPSERVYFFYQKQVGGEAGTIIAYYKDKITKQEIMTADIYSGLEYGTHQIDAATAPEKYTLETPTPQMIELSAAQPFKEVIFLYKGEPSIYNKPPVAIIDAPEWVYAGEDFHLSGKRSYDSDGTISEYQWKYDNEYTGCTLYDKKDGYIWFDYENNGRIELAVKDNQGATGTERHYVEILPPIPIAKITPTGILKENRKVNISAGSSWSPRHYPIDHSRNEWGFNIPDMKYKGIFSGKDKDVLFKQAGKKEICLKVWNTYYDPTRPNGFNGELTDDFIIQPDREPVADFSVPYATLRDKDDNNRATIVVTNASHSIDGDIIGKTVMFYAYDSNNDNIFDNETWYYSTDGATWQSVGMPYNQIKTGFDIYTKGTTNPDKFELKVNRNDVGKYKFEAMAIEDIPDDETIKEFLAPEDYKRADTFSSKSESEKICDVKNVAPKIDFEVQKITPMDLVVVTDYAQTDYDNLQSAIDVMKAQVLPLDVEPKVHMINMENSKKIAGERTVDKYQWDRYITAHISGPAYNTKGNFEFSGSVSINLESLSFFEGEENFPDRSKYSYQCSNIYITERENKICSMVYYYLNFDLLTYYNGQLQSRVNKEVSFGHGQYFNGLGTFFHDKDKLNISFDTTSFSITLSKGVYVSSEKRSFNSIDIDKIKNLAIDSSSNKYILFAISNFYSIAEINTTLKDYLQLNNYGIYVVANSAIYGKSVKMGPWEDIYYVDGAKSYLSGSKLYRYSGNELIEVTNTPRTIPTPVNSVTVELHEYKVRFSWSNKSERYRSTVLANNRYNETLSINNGSIKVNETTLNNVKCLYEAGDYYLVEQNNGDIYYFRRTIRYGGDENQYFDVYISNLEKLADANGIKGIKIIPYTDYTFNCYSYSNSPRSLTAKKIFVLDSNGNLYEGLSSNIVARTNYSELDYNYPEPVSRTTLGKIKTSISDYHSRVIDKQGSYYDPWSTLKTYNYQVVENDYAELAELGKLIKADLDVDMYADKNYISLAKLIGGTLKGNTYEAIQYAKALEDIIADISGVRGSSTSYILLNENLKYEVQYQDTDTNPYDPEWNRIWNYLHNPNYFENSMGLDLNSGKDISDPITSLGKVGKFDVKLKTHDKPKDNILFKNYWLPSAEKLASLYVHRKPIALIKLNITPNGSLFRIEAVDGGSYELDHESRVDKGIVAREWKGKEANEDTWRNERMNKPDCSGSKTYQVALRVKDLEGVWSDWAFQPIDNRQPPKAQFEIAKNPIAPDKLAQIKDKSYAISYAIMSNLTNWRWTVKNLDTNTVVQDQTFTNSNNGTGVMAGYDTNVKTKYDVGKYRIKLEVKADNGLWSDPYERELTVI